MLSIIQLFLVFSFFFFFVGLFVLLLPTVNPEDVFCFLLDTEQGEVLNQYVDIPNEFFTDNTCYEDMICLKPRVVFEMTCDPATKPLSNETTTVSDLECQNWMSQVVLFKHFKEFFMWAIHCFLFF